MTPRAPDQPTFGEVVIDNLNLLEHGCQITEWIDADIAASFAKLLQRGFECVPDRAFMHKHKAHWQASRETGNPSEIRRRGVRQGRYTTKPDSDIYSSLISELVGKEIPVEILGALGIEKEWSGNHEVIGPSFMATVTGTCYILELLTATV